MGLTRNPDTWSTSFGYLASTYQEPYHPIPVEDQASESCRTEGPLAAYQEYRRSSAVLQDSLQQQAAAYLQYPPTHAQQQQSPDRAFQQGYFSDVAYDYASDNYGATNVGTAVAMSLGSLNAVGPSRDCEASEVGHRTTSDQCIQGEYLLGELLSADPDLRLIDMCKAAQVNFMPDGDYFRAQYQVAKAEVSTESTYQSCPDKPWSRQGLHQSSECAEMQDIFQLGASTEERMTFPTSRHNAELVQKKYKLYGKWKPTDEGDEASPSCQDYVERSRQTTTQPRYEVPRYDKQGPYRDQERASFGTASEEACSPQGEAFGYRTEESNSSDRSNDSARSEERISKDQKRAKALKIPLSIEEIIGLPIDEFNERLSKFELTDPQLSLIRDIRRRGKNKVAAQNCRKRKLDQIYTLQKEVESLINQRNNLEAEREQSFNKFGFLEDRYYRLFQAVVKRNEPATDGVVEDLFTQ